MIKKIQSCCMRCLQCNQFNEDYDDYDYKKNEEVTVENKKQFDKLLKEIVIIDKNENVQINKLSLTKDINEDIIEKDDVEEEEEYVLC